MKNNNNDPHHPDIQFVTDKGTFVTLKWQGTEYRAYKNGYEMLLGATIPNKLIKYITKNY